MLKKQVKMVKFDASTTIKGRNKKYALDFGAYFSKAHFENSKGEVRDFIQFQKEWFLKDLKRASRVPQLQQGLAYGLAVLALFLYDKSLLPFGIAFGMAVAFDLDTDSGTAMDTTDPKSVTHTGTGSNLVGIASAGCRNDTAFSSVTYAGTAMTLQGVSSAGLGVAMYSIVGPTSGAQTVTMDITTSGAGTEWAYNISTYTGANAVDTFTSNEIGGNPMTLDITSATNNMVVGCCVDSKVGGPAFTVGAGQTQLMQVTGNNRGYCASYEAGASTTTHSYTTDGTGGDIAAVNVVAGSQVVAGGSHLLGLMGLGM